MLNHDLLDSLYKALPVTKRKALLHDLFGEGRQSMAYFRRNNDTSLSKVETMARYFDMPLDALIVDSKYVYDPCSLRIAKKGQPTQQPVTEASEGLLQERIKFLQEIASLRADKIQYLEEKIAALTAQKED